jgi:hypothetical protein
MIPFFFTTLGLLYHNWYVGLWMREEMIDVCGRDGLDITQLLMKRLKLLILLLDILWLCHW